MHLRHVPILMLALAAAGCTAPTPPPTNQPPDPQAAAQHARDTQLRDAIQRPPSADNPPAGTIMWTCGWWVRAEPQVCSTAVMPMRAPRCLGSAAIVSVVSAAAFMSRS